MPVKFDYSIHKDAVIKMSKSGASKSAIVRALGLPANSLNRNKEVSGWFNEGRDRLGKEVMSAIKDAITTSYLDRKMIVERLDLFYEPFPIRVIKSPKHAKEVMSGALVAFGGNAISSDKLNAISKACMTYIESYNQSVLQDDVAALKQLFAEHKK